MISIIVPIYNASRFLRECLDSLVGQSYRDLEIILVNDGSTDDSLTICEEYAAKDERVHVFSQENGGQMTAWIHGVKESHGDFIGFVDADDYASPDMFEKLMAAQTEHDADIVLCGRSVFDRFEEFLTIPPLETFYEGEAMEEIYGIVFPDLGACISQARWDKLFRREIVVENMERYCGKCVRTMEDRFIVSPALLSAKSLAVVKEPLIHCRLVNNSSSKKARPELYDIAELLYETQERILKDKGLYEKYKDKLECTRLDYLRMFGIRNIARKNNLSFKEKRAFAKKLLKDQRYADVVLRHKERCIGKFGKLIYRMYKFQTPTLFVIITRIYGIFVEKENKNGF